MHAADELGVSQASARRLLSDAVRQGALETSLGARGATIYRLPGNRLDDGEDER